MMRKGLTALLLVALSGAAARAQDQEIHFTLATAKGPYKGPVCVPLSVPEAAAKLTFVYLEGKGQGQSFGALAQFTAPGLATEAVAPSAKGLVRRDLHFPADLASESAVEVTVELKQPNGVPRFMFAWKDTPGEHADLFLGERPVARYMYTPYDPAKDKRDLTYKVFHHLYDPEGKRFVTNGGQTDDPKADPKKLLYPHHRGLMYAFNNITFGDGVKCDTWHAKPGDTHEAHVKFLAQEAGSVLGRHRVAVDWHGPKNEVFAKEERELTFYNVPGAKGVLVDFVSRLKTAGGKVKLDGDPQHAGFQFRAANDVAEKTKAQTYYLRPDGKGKPGETRNWDPKTKEGPVDLPWDAMSFVLDGKRYSVAYLSHPQDPTPSRWSERDYGRFGCYFPYELTEDRPLLVRYRVWLQSGEMTQEQVEALHRAFVDPPKITTK